VWRPDRYAGPRGWPRAAVFAICFAPSGIDSPRSNLAVARYECFRTKASLKKLRFSSVRRRVLVGSLVWVGVAYPVSAWNGKSKMKVLSLELENFRGVKEAMHLDFAERSSAIVGINGAGKSTVLDALAIALSQFTWRIIGQPLKARPIAVDDIHIGQSWARIAISVELCSEVVTWSVAVNRRRGTGARRVERSNLEGLKNAVKRFNESWEYAEIDRQHPFDLPLTVFYDVNRAVLNIPMRVRDQLNHDYQEIYADALDHGGADFKRFFIWFRNREDIENEERRDRPRFREPALEAARTAIQTFTGFKNLRIRRAPLRMTVEKDGLEFNVAQLSDGERNMLAMVGDLARRLSVLNPGLRNTNEGSGVVLIDEIDLHLHPGWQRTVVQSLENTFPGCQFILTTHSPQVIGELEAKGVLLLRDGRSLGHAERALGLTSGEVLEELMNGQARNADVSSELLKIQKLIDSDAILKAENALKRLKKKVGEIPEVLRMESSISALQWMADIDE